ncbi:hypothetical protein ABZW18_06140 [Streptomyces sp. NPDC004647]|uniref:hypothetical protein n=1 Tax=Streptomyces sp. NPDC004647 TaxID=3154671 RepID=UPI0033B0F803
MAGSTLRIMAPSGDRLALYLADEAPVRAVATNVRFVGGAYSRGFQIGSRGYHDFVRKHVIKAASTDRFVVKGRETVVAATADGNTTIVTLLERYHELMTVFSGPAPSRETLIGLFGTLEIQDHPRGMRVRPERFTQGDTALQQTAVTVADRGTIVVPGPRQARRMVPKHRGKSTRHGELWRVPLPGRSADSASEHDYLYVVAGAKGAAEIRIDPGSRLDASALLTWVDGIDAAWTAA